MNKRPLLLLSLFLLLSSAMLVGTMATAQATDWAPPNADSPAGGALTQVYLDSSSQIKAGGIGLDTGNTLLNLPAGAGLYASTGAALVDWPGASQSINASPGNAISTNGRIRSHRIFSTGGIQSDVLKSTGTAEKVVCVDLGTGKLKLCGIALGPTITFSANPTTTPTPDNVRLTWSTTTAVSCVGTNFSTGPGNPPNGAALVWAANTTTYTVTCTDTMGQQSSKSVTVTVGTPPPSITISAAPAIIPNGQQTTVTWSSTNSVGCVPIAPLVPGFSTGGAAAGSDGVFLLSFAPPQTYIMSIRCTGPTGLTADASTSVLVN